MGYIGQTPSAVPLDGSDIADDIVDSQHYVDGSIDTAHLADDQITLAKMAAGTDGNIISYDASGNPVAIATGSDGQVLTSTGAGSPPAFEAIPASGLSSKVVGATYDLSTASGTQDITGFGFQPTAVHALMFINVTDDWCHSFTNFTASRGMHAASTTTAVVYGTAAFAVITTSADNVRQTANPVTALADGIRITWTKQNSPTGTLQQYFIGYK